MGLKLTYIHNIKHKVGEQIPDHIHSSMEIVLYRRSNGHTVINEKQYRINDNSVAVIHPGQIHREIHNKESDILYFGFVSDGSEFANIESGVYSPLCVDTLILSADRMYRESRTQKVHYEDLLSAYLTEFLIMLKRDIGRNTTDSAKSSLEYCANYLRENHNQKIDIKEMSREFGYSYDSFRRSFKKAYGLAPQDYVIYHRLLKARQMISETNVSCTDIAMLCGFSDSSQFSKMYKRKFGITPKRHRHSSKDGEN
ncbi:MAG: helix-turn-helix domain-containing protein [Ruminococcaceae bacterium]|nr:helix-turn-helix domain-containing protein [Oscillospiraceae bacterium]